jgi:hypothetical protein
MWDGGLLSNCSGAAAAGGWRSASSARRQPQKHRQQRLDSDTGLWGVRVCARDQVVVPGLLARCSSLARASVGEEKVLGSY